MALASRLHKRMRLRRKLHILKTLTNSKSVKKSSIIIDTFLHIYQLKLKLEAIKREHQYYLMKHVQEVGVEKVGDQFAVRVTCSKGQDVLVSILETFEELSLHVLEARVSSNCFLSIEAIVEAQGQGIIGVSVIKEAIQKAIAVQV